MDDNRKELEITDTLKNLITRFQDTVHDTAITYHRKLREKEITKSCVWSHVQHKLGRGVNV